MPTPDAFEYSIDIAQAQRKVRVALEHNDKTTKSALEAASIKNEDVERVFAVEVTRRTLVVDHNISLDMYGMAGANGIEVVLKPQPALEYMFVKCSSGKWSLDIGCVRVSELMSCGQIFRHAHDIDRIFRRESKWFVVCPEIGVQEIQKHQGEAAWMWEVEKILKEMGNGTVGMKI